MLVGKGLWRHVCNVPVGPGTLQTCRHSPRRRLPHDDPEMAPALPADAAVPGRLAVVYQVLGASMSAAQSQAFSTLGILPIMLLLAATPGRLTGTRRLRGSVYALASGLLSGLGNLAYYLAIEAGGKASTAASLSA